MNIFFNKKKKSRFRTTFSFTKRSFGFTLIELLVVIFIIGLLSGIILSNMQGARDTARIASALRFSKTVGNTIGVDLVGFWGLDENGSATCSSGKDICDKSGYNNDGDNIGAIWSDDTPSNNNYALEFSLSDYLHFEDNLKFDFTDKTVELWIKTTQSNTGIIGQEGKWLITVSPSGYVRFNDLVADTSIEGSIVVNDGKWHNVIVATSVEEGEAMIYVDGQFDVKTSIEILETEGAIYLGSCYRVAGSGYCANNYLDGKIDEVKIYSQALNL